VAIQAGEMDDGVALGNELLELGRIAEKAAVEGDSLV